MANGERYKKGEDEIIIKHWGAIPDWRGIMYEFHKKGYDRSMEQIRQRAFRLSKHGRIPCIGQGKKAGITVRCVETGKVFKTMTQAATYYAGSPKSSAAISNVLRDKAKTAYGFHWVRG